jgi:prevent-host-death family protein
MSVSEANSQLSKVLNRAAFAGERVVITSRGTPKAAVISINDLELLEELEDALAAREALEAHRAGDTVAWEDARCELLE